MAVLLAELGGFFLEHVDELITDDLALLLRVAHSGKFREEAFGGVHRDQVQAQAPQQVGRPRNTTAVEIEALPFSLS